MRGHCAALREFYRQTSSVVEVPEVVDTLIMHIGQIDLLPRQIIVELKKGRLGIVPFVPEQEPMPGATYLDRRVHSLDAVGRLSEQAGELRAYAALYKASK